jgi:hypothetical protein
MQKYMAFCQKDCVNTVGYENILVDKRKYAISNIQSPVWAKSLAVMEALEKYPDAEIGVVARHKRNHHSFRCGFVQLPA